jgi:hypothetical protein
MTPRTPVFVTTPLQPLNELAGCPWRISLSRAFAGGDSALLLQIDQNFRLPGQLHGLGELDKTSRCRTTVFGCRFRRFADWRDRRRASQSRASCRTSCCNALWRDGCQLVRWLSRTKTVENATYELSAKQTARLEPAQESGRVSMPAWANRSRAERRSCCEFRGKRTKRKTAISESTA